MYSYNTCEKKERKKGDEWYTPVLPIQYKEKVRKEVRKGGNEKEEKAWWSVLRAEILSFLF